VIRDDSVSGVHSIDVLLSKFPRVRSSTGEFLDLVEDGSEDVGVVVGSNVLKNGNESLETHSSVDVPVGKRSKGSVEFSVVLHEHVVPDLEDVGVVVVDEVSGVSTSDSVVVDLAGERNDEREKNEVSARRKRRRRRINELWDSRARSTGSSSSHLCERGG